MLSKESKQIIVENLPLVDKHIKRWIKEALLDQKANIDWDKLLGYFNKITQKGCRVVNGKARKQFRARIADGYSKEDISNAIYNCYHSDHHRESNWKYLTLEFISRADKMDMYLNAEPELVTQEQKRNDSL